MPGRILRLLKDRNGCSSHACWNCVAFLVLFTELARTGGEKLGFCSDFGAVAMSFVFFVVSADGREFDAEHCACPDFRRFDEDSSAVVFFDDAFGKRQT